jgi:hypothetical protein
VSRSLQHHSKGSFPKLLLTDLSKKNIHPNFHFIFLDNLSFFIQADRLFHFGENRSSVVEDDDEEDHSPFGRWPWISLPL